MVEVGGGWWRLKELGEDRWRLVDSAGIGGARIPVSVPLLPLTLKLPPP